jgi:biopolymer transport protein TolQ
MNLYSNPFIDAYVHSDLLGKIIFISLIFLSIISWIILLYKVILTRSIKKRSKYFYSTFQKYRHNPLGMEIERVSRAWNPYLDLYQILKKYTLEVLNKNRKFSQKVRQEEESASYLSRADLDFVESHLISSVATQTKNLDRYLYILSTIVSLAPFIGLLGTVWGILTTFSQMQNQSSHLFLGGLSLALATTVLGLIDAIPALIGYNYLKNQVREFEVELDNFSNEILATVEFQYRKVDAL